MVEGSFEGEIRFAGECGCEYRVLLSFSHDGDSYIMKYELDDHELCERHAKHLEKLLEENSTAREAVATALVSALASEHVGDCSLSDTDIAYLFRNGPHCEEETSFDFSGSEVKGALQAMMEDCEYENKEEVKKVIPIVEKALTDTEYTANCKAIEGNIEVAGTILFECGCKLEVDGEAYFCEDDWDASYRGTDFESCDEHSKLLERHDEDELEDMMLEFFGKDIAEVVELEEDYCEDVATFMRLLMVGGLDGYETEASVEELLP